MPQVLELNELHTLIVGLIALGLGAYARSRIPGLGRLGLPISVIGGESPEGTEPWRVGPTWTPSITSPGFTSR